MNRGMFFLCVFLYAVMETETEKVTGLYKAARAATTHNTTAKMVIPNMHTISHV